MTNRELATFLTAWGEQFFGALAQFDQTMARLIDVLESTREARPVQRPRVVRDDE